MPENINDAWSIEFVHDQLHDSKSMRLFNVLDNFNREAIAISINFSLPASRVVRSLDQVIEWRGKPLKIRCDHELNARTFSSGGQSHPVTVNCSLKNQNYHHCTSPKWSLPPMNKESRLVLINTRSTTLRFGLYPTKSLRPNWIGQA